MKKIDEGLVEVMNKVADEVNTGGRIFIGGNDFKKLALAIQSYLKKEGWAKLPGKYVVKKGCLVKID